LLVQDKETQDRAFFGGLCADYYEKVLKYLFYALKSESAARDVTQEVFLAACQKRALLRQHSNPGGFLFQTAKNLANKARSEGYRRMLRDMALDDLPEDPADHHGTIEAALDREIDEREYIEAALESLSDEKRRLYALYYAEKKSMAEIAGLLGLEEPALRMRFVRLRREIRGNISRIAEQYFSS
jgi:RNA polymerase sigma-70 factor (ECF subfamily)